MSSSALAKILRDPYYTGMLPFKGELYPGRHSAVITQETFVACQSILDRRNRKGDRDFVHFHYLKGMLYCGLCADQGRTRRLVYSQSTGNGGTYEYWVRSGKQRDHCTLGTLRMEDLEEQVALEVTREGFTSDDIEALRSRLHLTRDHMGEKDRQMKASLTAELRKLEDHEVRLIELAADGSVSTPKLRDKLNQITLKKGAVANKLSHTLASLNVGVETADAQLDLLDNPGKLYRGSPHHVRRDVLAGLFNKFTVHRDELGEVVLAAERTVINAAVQELNGRCGNHVTPAKSEEASRISTEGFLASTFETASSSKGWNILELVGVTGFEPAASSSRTTRATKLRHTPLQLGKSTPSGGMLRTIAGFGRARTGAFVYAGSSVRVSQLAPRGGRPRA